ncbi:unnamed protein product [Rotaria socialis]|uniref:Carboxylic ester hydrolase n=1 Tax=Rotaria socialis TaxID=392032 RepID=A0A818BGZ6_9BILA|nr:unnamed protein product [Rotaria socialis]CAF3452892.1 unnamed protein product [Rotaria socialis]CAF3488493.1 unnamed protein product [Rotaria socialis]CAF3599103.1 unnamed protein product [Rotaria socialis]CAF4352973.1 unnamed protein product [Rotaria socialis]
MLFSIIFICLTYICNSKIFGEACVYSSDPLVRCTTEGLVRGKIHNFTLDKSNLTSKSIESDSVYAFLGVPYAEPPDGEKRFRKPIPKRARPRGVIYNATTLPNSCYQMIIDFFNTTGEQIWVPFTPLSEDCLYLNIWTPINNRQEGLLAVMVWFYGGGFQSGSTTLKLYDGSILSSTQNIIVISIEYRVESLGFLYLGTRDAPGNQGLFDQQIALEWIYKNIRSFGGDPQRITLFGESSGAISVGLHLLSPKSRPLFNNGILESSGPAAKWAVLTPQIAKYRSEKFLDVFTRYITERYESGPSDPEYAYIPKQCKNRMVTIEEKFLCVKYYPILNQNHFRSSWALESYNGGPIGYTFVPAIDGDFIPYDPEQMLINRDFKKCPILLGVNRDEGSYFNVYVPYGNMSINAWPYVDYKTFKHALKEYFRYIPTYPTERAPMLLESIIQTYTIWNDYNNTIQNAIQLSLAVGDYYFTCPTVLIADIYAQDHVPVYFYYFTLRSSVSPWHEWMGVLHADELMFVFGEPLNVTDSLNYTNEEVIVSQKMMTYWANFAKYSNPNQGHDTQWNNEWRSYKWPTREHIVLNSDLSKNQFPEHGSALRAEYCSFWLDFIPKLTSANSNISEDEVRWKQEFRQYQERTQQWEYYYSKYLELLEKNREKLYNCLG